jgi:serine/threonine protein phosphatase PrpC
MVGRPVGAEHWLLRRRADESELELTLSEDRCVLLGRFSRPGVQQSWRIVLEQSLPLLSPGLVTKRPGTRPKPPRRPSLVASHYSLVAGQWRNGEARQRDALLLAGKVWQHARMGLRRTEIFAADVLVGLATGLPGHPAAPAASRIVLDALRRLLIERPELRTAGRPGHRLMVEVQRDLHRRLGRRPHGRGAGASVLVAHLRGAELLVLAIGTCRAVWLGVDGTSSVLGLAQDHMALRRPRTEFVPPHGYPTSFRHPTQALSADGDSDLLAVQLVRRTLAAGDSVLLLSPGAVDALVPAQSCDDVELLDALRRPMLGARSTLARAGRIKRALQTQLAPHVGCSSLLLLCYPGPP